jgi:hypothetical protein
MIKSRRMRWTGNLARIGVEEKNIQNIGGEGSRKETARKIKK